MYLRILTKFIGNVMKKTIVDKKRKNRIMKNRLNLFIFCFCCIVSFIAGVQHGIASEGIFGFSSIQNVFVQNIMHNSNLPLSKMKIVVDAGHGGADSGTLAPVTGTYEADLNLEVSYKLKAALEAMGAEVVMTRTSKSSKQLGDSKKLTMDERGVIIEKANADMLLSIHQNFNEDSSTIRGTQILVRDENSVPFANALQNAFNSELNTNLNFIKKDYTVLQYGNQPSVIIECGFFSNKKEEKLLQTDEYQKKLIDIIVQNVENYKKGLVQIEESENTIV